MKQRFIKIVFLAVIVGLSAAIANIAGGSQASRASRRNLNFEAEKLLAERGYWITKVDKKRDSSTYHAIVAFQKVEKLRRTGRLTKGLISALKKAKRPEPAYSGPPHIEIDISRQVLFLVDESEKVTHILPVSTGNEKFYYQDGKRQIAHTPRGIFKIRRQIKGIRRAPLGVLYHPNYFVGGVAIHGSGSIPFYPASHGCVRIPKFAARKFSALVSVGMYVVVFDKRSEPRPALPVERSEKKETARIIPCGKPQENNDGLVKATQN